MEGHGGADAWASMRDEFQPQSNPHPSDHSIQGSMSNTTPSQFNPGDGRTYNYHHERHSVPGEQLHNPSHYYQPVTKHTIGAPVDGNHSGIGTQGGGGNTTPRPLGH
ncbi:hypothetical protein H4Q26_015502 [Puccinia striiformis f. sp. tritici PST-130]|nr:hypothetical protein H4Q26_015502 [Puccinia striiformis f. sp. tritici PST-130]